jgi:hypothetical protein
MGGILDVDWETLIESRVSRSRRGENKMAVWCDELSQVAYLETINMVI